MPLTLSSCSPASPSLCSPFGQVTALHHCDAVRTCPLTPSATALRLIPLQPHAPRSHQGFFPRPFALTILCLECSSSRQPVASLPTFSRSPLQCELTTSHPPHALATASCSFPPHHLACFAFLHDAYHHPPPTYHSFADCRSLHYLAKGGHPINIS